jgi:hypothetical protein
MSFSTNERGKNNMKAKKVFEWFGLLFREIGNFLTNLLVPLLTVVIFIVEVLPIPKKDKVLLWLKKVEYWVFYASGTAKILAKRVLDKAEEEELKE